MDNQDIIKTALDILQGDNRNIKLVTGGGHNTTWYGTLTGLGSMGDHATITVFGLHFDPALPGIPDATLIDVDTILSIEIQEA